MDRKSAIYELIFQMKKEGCSQKEISAATGKSREQIGQILKNGNSSIHNSDDKRNDDFGS